MTRSPLCNALALLLPLFLGSCATRLACDFSAPRLQWKHAKTPKGGSEEARVASYIVGRKEDGFTLSRVDHITHVPHCGLDLLSTFLTLGLVPHSWPNPVNVTVTGSVDGRKKTKTFALKLHRSTSLWHNLLPASSDDRAIARAVLQALREQKVLDPKYHHWLQESE